MPHLGLPLPGRRRRHGARLRGRAGARETPPRRLLAVDKEEEKYVLEFTPTVEHDFGRVEISKSVSKKIRIVNTDASSGPFTGSVEIIDSPNFSMDFSGILVLQKNESKEIYLSFIPTASEEYTGKLVVKNDKSFNEFYLSGIGGNPVSFSIDPVGLNFGLVVAGNTKDLDLVFKNSESSGFDLELSLDLSLIHI